MRTVEEIIADWRSYVWETRPFKNEVALTPKHATELRWYPEDSLKHLNGRRLYDAEWQLNPIAQAEIDDIKAARLQAFEDILRERG